jgi:DNA-binding MarR family transcriptional regulator
VNEKDQDLLQEGWGLFTRIFMKYDVLEKEPIDIGNGDKLNAAQIHLIEAVGKGYGKTVTTLSGYFMITKGAVSQVVSKLHEMGYVAKTKRKGNDKEIILELTEKGWMAFVIHEKYNESTISDLMQFRDKYSEGEIVSFLKILNDIDHLLSKFITEEKKK